MPMMKCGHAANGKDNKTGKPCCVMCLGIVSGAKEIDENPPDLTGRISQCSCGHEEPSNDRLPFFKHYPKQERDSHYCGCRGWD